MGPLPVRVDKSAIQVRLEGLHQPVEFPQKRLTEELVQDRPVEALYEPVGSGATHPGAPVLGVVERQIELVGVSVAESALPAVVPEDCRDLQAPLPVKRKHVVVEHGHAGVRALGDVEEGEGALGVGVHHGVQSTIPTLLTRPT